MRLMYADPLDSFTDRESICSQYEHFLHTSQPGQLRLLAIKGNSGTGKTFLIEYLSRRLCPVAGWLVGQLTFAQSTPDFRRILEDLEDALKNCVPRSSLQLYREQRETYKRSFDTYHATITVSQRVEAREQSHISNIQQNIQVNAELHRRELQLRAELTRALLELAEESLYPLCLFIDGYEHLADADSELVGWLWEEVLLKLARKTSHPLLVVTCGWLWPDNVAIKPFAHQETLDDFDETCVSNYLHKQGVLFANLALLKQQELLTTFYELTRGHPLVLALAVAYFQELPESERNSVTLHTNKPLFDEKARIEWLYERLLNRLAEPYRILLERGPILRTLDHAVLRVLVCTPVEGMASLDTLDNYTYEQFLLYPFFSQGHLASDGTLARPMFHDLLRHIHLKALRHHYSDTCEKLHHIIAVYYRNLAGLQYQQSEKKVSDGGDDEQWIVNVSGDEQWIVNVSGDELQVHLEYLYHALQVQELQADAFSTWNTLTGLAVNRWRRRWAGQLLEVVQHLIAEAVPFFSQTSPEYGTYLLLYSNFLGQEARWDEAVRALEEAEQVFKYVGNPIKLFASLNNIGEIYRQKGEPEQALAYYERALALAEWVGDPVERAAPLNNIGLIYGQQGKLEQALDYFERALVLYKQVGNPIDVAAPLNNIGLIYRQQGKLEQALNYFESTLILREQGNCNPVDMATSLNNIGEIYRQQGKLEQGLDYLEQALSILEQISNFAAIATSLNSIGAIYYAQGESKQALSCFKRALALGEQADNSANIASSLNNIGAIYYAQGELEQALDHFKRTLVLREQMSNPAEVAAPLNNIGAIYFDQGKLEQALDHFNRALVLGEQASKPADVAASLDNIGLIYRQQGKLEQALHYFKRALSFLEQEGNPAEVVASLSNIGAIHYGRGELKQASSYLERRLPFDERLGNYTAMITSLLSIAEDYYAQGELEQSLIYYKRALAAHKHVDNPATMAISLNDIGLIYYYQGKLENALAYYVRALPFYEQVGKPADIAGSLANIGSVYLLQGKWEEALDHYKRSVPFFEQSGNSVHLAASLNNISFIYKQLGNLQEALAYDERAQAYRDISESPSFAAHKVIPPHSSSKTNSEREGTKRKAKNKMTKLSRKKNRNR